MELGEEVKSEIGKIRKIRCIASLKGSRIAQLTVGRQGTYLCILHVNPKKMLKYTWKSVFIIVRREVKKYDNVLLVLSC